MTASSSHRNEAPEACTVGARLSATHRTLVTELPSYRASRPACCTPTNISAAGEFGERIVEDLQTNGGLITFEDLASYAVRVYEPLQIEYRGFRVLGLSPTSGSMTAFEAMNMLATFDLQGMTAASAGVVHLIAE